MTATIDPYLQGKLPDYNDPVVLPKSHTSVEDFCNRLHKGIIKQFKYALVWGTSTKHRPQKVGKDHVLEDEDIVQLVSHARGAHALPQHTARCCATSVSQLCCNTKAVIALPLSKQEHGTAMHGTDARQQARQIHCPFQLGHHLAACSPASNVEPAPENARDGCFERCR